MIQFKPEHFQQVYVPITVLEDAIQRPAGEVREAAQSLEEKSLAASQVGLYCVEDVIAELKTEDDDD